MSHFNKWLSVRNGEVAGLATSTCSQRRCSQVATEGRCCHAPHLPPPPPPHHLALSLPPPGRQLDSVRAEAAEKGDVGLVAENSRTTQRLMLPPPILTASGVFSKFRDIARLTGSTVSRAGRSPPYPRPSAPHLGDPKPCVWQEGFC